MPVGTAVGQFVMTPFVGIFEPEQSTRRPVLVADPYEVDRVFDQLAATGDGAAMLWHNDRFDRVYGRGWGDVYEHLLDGIRARGGTAGTGAALCDWWKAERCAS